MDDVLGRIARRPATAARMFWERSTSSPDDIAYRFPVGAAGHEVWQDVTWAEARVLVEALAAGLVALGVEPGDRVAILSTTRVDWILADLAILCAGAASVGVRPTGPPAEVAHVVDDSDSVVVFAEDLEQVATLWAVRADIRQVRKVVVFDGDHPDRRVMTLEELLGLGQDLLTQDPTVVARRVESLGPEMLAGVVYTSGADGRPRGARLPHSSWTYPGTALRAEGLVGPDDRQLLWLPLSDAFGQALLAAQLACGFPLAVDGRVDRVLDNLALLEPTFVGTTPAFLERVHARVVSAAEQDRSASIRGLVGARFRFFVSGGEPLDPDVAELLHVAGITVLEGYGPTESAGATAVNVPADHRLGTVGRPLPGTEVRIAEDGEVLVRGPGVMEGYHKLPAETASVLVDGWLHTGDIGHLEPDGHLVVAGRRHGR